MNSTENGRIAEAKSTLRLRGYSESEIQQAIDDNMENLVQQIGHEQAVRLGLEVDG